VFIRKKLNKSGVISVQVIDKSRGKYQLVKTVGSSSDPKQVEVLSAKADQLMRSLSGQNAFNFEIEKEKELIDLFFGGLDEIRLVGPELYWENCLTKLGSIKSRTNCFAPW